MIVTPNGPQNIDQVKTHFECGNLFLSPDEYQRKNAWNREPNGCVAHRFCDISRSVRDAPGPGTECCLLKQVASCNRRLTYEW